MTLTSIGCMGGGRKNSTVSEGLGRLGNGASHLARGGCDFEEGVRGEDEKMVF